MTIGIKVKIISFVVANNTYFMLCLGHLLTIYPSDQNIFLFFTNMSNLTFTNVSNMGLQARPSR